MTCGAMVSAASAGRMKWVTAQPAANAAAMHRVVAIRFMVRPPRWGFFGGPMLGRQGSDRHGHVGEKIVRAPRNKDADPAFSRTAIGRPKSPSQAFRTALCCRQTTRRNQ